MLNRPDRTQLCVDRPAANRGYRRNYDRCVFFSRLTRAPCGITEITNSLRCCWHRNSPIKLVKSSWLDRWQPCPESSSIALQVSNHREHHSARVGLQLWHVPPTLNHRLPMLSSLFCRLLGLCRPRLATCGLLPKPSFAQQSDTHSDPQKREWLKELLLRLSSQAASTAARDV